MTSSFDAGRSGEKAHLLSVAEAAAHLGVAEAFVRRLVLQRRVRFYKVGRYVRFRTADLNAFVDAGRHDPVEIDTHDLVGQTRPNGATTGRGVAASGSTARRRGVASRGN